MQNKSITIPILNDEYKVIVCWGSEKFILKTGKDWGYGDTVILEEKRRGACFFRPSCHPIIVLRGRPVSPQEVATLSHEAIHAISDILYNKIEEKTNCEEIFAHSVGAIVRKVLT